MIQKSFSVQTRGENSKQFWITPPELYKELDDEFNFDFDPCPFPRQSFDGITSDWGASNFVNPPYSKKDGPSYVEWEKKALIEHRKGKTVVLLKPLNVSEYHLWECKPEVRLLGRIPWVATDGSGDRHPTRYFIAMIMKGNVAKHQQKREVR